MQLSEDRPDHQVYVALGRLITAVSNLEHELDLAILAINEDHASWLKSVSPRPPMKLAEKAKIIASFAVTQSHDLRDDYRFLVDNLYELRNALLHGRLRGWEKPIDEADSAIYITRLVVNNDGGLKSMGLSTAVVAFGTIQEATARAWHLAQMTKAAVPLGERHDIEMEGQLKTFRQRRGVPDIGDQETE